MNLKSDLKGLKTFIMLIKPFSQSCFVGGCTVLSGCATFPAVYILRNSIYYIYFQSGGNTICRSIKIDFVLMLDGSQHMGRHEFEVRFLSLVRVIANVYP